MCCSAGRFDSLGKPRKYPIPLPQIKVSQTNQYLDSFLTIHKSLSPDSSSDITYFEGSNISMINVMVDFAVILRRISKDIYHCHKEVDASQKSTAALSIDALLDQWKRRLPPWHNFDVIDFREPEWAAKQKLVLQLRYLNARVILHRPFLSDSTTSIVLERQKHIDLCLDAARKTIQVLYDAYANKHYFRTWWYNSTYTLYAGMIVLYVIMLEHSTVAHNILLADVKKSRDILRSMEEASVARRSADLLSEVLEIAIARTQKRQDTRTNPSTKMASTSLVTDNNVRQEPSTLPSDTTSTGFAQDPEAFMASLIDPTILQDFTTDSNDWLSFDFSSTLEEFQGSIEGWNNAFSVNSNELDSVTT
jgi:hypothetical protein